MSIKTAFISWLSVNSDAYKINNTAFQSDDTWKHIRFSTSNNVINNVIKISLEFEAYPDQEILIKDLTVHACIPGGTYALSRSSNDYPYTV